jgi:hypothetical protein
MEEELTEHRGMGIEPAFGAAYSGQDFGNLQAER